MKNRKNKPNTTEKNHYDQKLGSVNLITENMKNGIGEVIYHYKAHAIVLPMNTHNDILVPYLRNYMFEHKKKENQEVYLDQLDSVVSEWDIQGGSLPDRISNLFCMNVFVLTELGIIENDEWNGVQYIHIVKGGLVFGS